MFASSLRRPTDRASAQQRKEAKNGPGRRAPEKSEKPQAPVLCGWNLPIIPDDNDIIVWMKREKNGDNKRKKINEVYEEEHYRHITGHCAAIENKLLFDRQSLHDRYLKNCQFGVRDARANKVTPVTPLPGVQRTRGTRPPSQQDRDRNCYSANALEDEHGAVEEQEEVEEEKPDVGVRRVSRSRSHSAVCHSASMRAYGMTLPDCRGTVMTEEKDNVKDEGEDAGWDEGYGSKVSSNDQEQDGVEEDSTKTVDADSGAGEDSVLSSVSKVGPVLNPCQAHPLSHQDAMAKLMYSRRERTVYERLPSRRMRGNSFRYAGREQSRLMEASLSHINPAYLARYHHLADLANMARQTPQLKHGSSEQCSPQDMEEGGSAKGLQPRTMVLRKITIQDSGKELFSQNIHSSPGGEASASSSQSSADKVYKSQGVVSPARTQPETKSSVSQTSTSRVPSSEHVSVTVQDLTPELASRNSPNTLVTSQPVPSVQTTSVMSMLSVPSVCTDGPHASSPMMSPSRASPASDRLSSMSSFAVTDLLPAVERNLRSQRTTQRGLSKSRTMDVTASSFNRINNRHNQQQQKQQKQNHHRPQPHQAASGSKSQSNGEAISAARGVELQEGSMSSRGKEENTNRPPPLPNGMVSGPALKNAPPVDDVRTGFPGFRPYCQATPLQRAREIANRRMHGHVTQMPDGSETVRVPSPRYASRTEQQSSHRRAKSASRFPPLLRQRTQQGGKRDVPVTSLSKAHSSLTTSLSRSHGTLLTREDMAARLEHL